LVTIYDLKPRFQALLRPIARGLVGAGATANGSSLAALAQALSLAAGAVVLRVRLDRLVAHLLQRHPDMACIPAVMRGLGKALAWNGDRRQLMTQLEERMAALLAELHPSSWE
jgi:hypothetical protein